MNEDKSKVILRDLMNYANSKAHKTPTEDKQPENTPTEEKEWKPCSLGAEKREDGGVEITVKGEAGDLMCLAGAICNSLYHTFEDIDDGGVALLVFKLMMRKVMDGKFKDNETRIELPHED